MPEVRPVTPLGILSDRLEKLSRDVDAAPELARVQAVTALDSTPHFEYQGEVVFFCCEGCRDKYAAQISA